jgi:hypothetical protein
MTVITPGNNFMKQLAQWMAFGNHAFLRASSPVPVLEKEIVLASPAPPG